MQKSKLIQIFIKSYYVPSTELDIEGVSVKIFSLALSESEIIRWSS